MTGDEAEQARCGGRAAKCYGGYDKHQQKWYVIVSGKMYRPNCAAMATLMAQALWNSALYSVPGLGLLESGPGKEAEPGPCVSVAGPTLERRTSK